LCDVISDVTECMVRARLATGSPRIQSLSCLCDVISGVTECMVRARLATGSPRI
jgi:hypothetical protein